MVMICKGFVSNSQMGQSILLLCGEILRFVCDAVLFVTHELFPIYIKSPEEISTQKNLQAEKESQIH
jgi:hypothetical protein